MAKLTMKTIKQSMWEPDEEYDMSIMAHQEFEAAHQERVQQQNHVRAVLYGDLQDDFGRPIRDW